MGFLGVWVGAGLIWIGWCRGRRLRRFCLGWSGWWRRAELTCGRRPEISRRFPPEGGIRVVCGPMAPSSAGAATMWVRLTHPTEISRRCPPGHTIRVGCGPMAPSSAGASTHHPGSAIAIRVRLSHPTGLSRRSPPDYTIRVGCGPVAPSFAGAKTARARLTHPAGILRRSTPGHTVRVGCGPMAPSSAGAKTAWPGRIVGGRVPGGLTHPTGFSRRSP